MTFQIAGRADSAAIPIIRASGPMNVKIVKPNKTWRVVQPALVKAEPRDKLMVATLMKSADPT